MSLKFAFILALSFSCNESKPRSTTARLKEHHVENKVEKNQVKKGQDLNSLADKAGEVNTSLPKHTEPVIRDYNLTCTFQAEKNQSVCRVLNFENSVIRFSNSEIKWYSSKNGVRSALAPLNPEEILERYEFWVFPYELINGAFVELQLDQNQMILKSTPAAMKYQIIGEASRRCITAPDNVGVQFKIYDCMKGSPNQLFTLEELGAEVFKIVTHRGHVMEIGGGVPHDRAQLQAGYYEQKNYQQFRIQPQNLIDYHPIYMRDTASTFDAVDFGTANGTGVVVWRTDTPAANQKWMIKLAQ